MSVGMPKGGFGWLCIALAFTVSAVAFHSWLTFGGIPPRASLQIAEGRLARVERNWGLIRFGLDGQDGSFEYLSSNGAMGAAGDALSMSRRPMVTVLTAPRDVAADAQHDVFELAVDGRVVASHAQVAESRATNARIAGGLSLLMAACGGHLLIHARRARRRRRELRFLRLPERRRQ